MLTLKGDRHVCLPQSLLAGEVAVRLSLDSVWLTVAVRWVPVVTDSSSLPCESGYHGSQHTDSPQGPQASGPRPQAKCNPHSGLPDSWGLCRGSCKDSAAPRERVLLEVSLPARHTVYIPLYFQEETHSLLFLKTGGPLGLSFVFLFLKNILLP